MIHDHDLDYGRVLVVSDGICAIQKRNDIAKANSSANVTYKFKNISLETMLNMADATGAVTIIPGTSIEFLSEHRRRQVKVLSAPDAYRNIIMAVGRTCTKQAIIDAVDRTIMSIAEQYAASDFLRS